MRITNIEQFLAHGEYSTIIKEAERCGYKRSREAIEREHEEGSVGQYGITLDEATAYLRRWYVGFRGFKAWSGTL